MHSVPLESLPPPVRYGCEALRDGLVERLGDNLLALWVYGATVFDDRPTNLGDVDTHGVLREAPDGEMAAAVWDLHETTAGDFAVEWDSWYILERDAAGRSPPRHALREDLVDSAWALHRAHWLAGQYVRLHGLSPSDLVLPPTWTELVGGLEAELRFIEGTLLGGHRDPGYGAFVVWNGCRILASLDTRDAVMSKRAAARWALEHTPVSWHAAIRAAGRVYDATPTPEDAHTLEEAMLPVVETVRDAIRKGRAAAHG